MRKRCFEMVFCDYIFAVGCMRMEILKVDT